MILRSKKIAPCGKASEDGLVTLSLTFSLAADEESVRQVVVFVRDHKFSDVALLRMEIIGEELTRFVLTAKTKLMLKVKETSKQKNAVSQNVKTYASLLEYAKTAPDVPRIRGQKRKAVEQVKPEEQTVTAETQKTNVKPKKKYRRRKKRAPRKETE